VWQRLYTTLRGGPVADVSVANRWCLHWRRRGLGFPLWLLGLVDGVWVAALLKASYECFVYILHVVFKSVNCIVEHMICCVVDRCKCCIIALTDKLYSCRKILISQYKCQVIMVITMYCTVIGVLAQNSSLLLWVEALLCLAVHTPYFCSDDRLTAILRYSLLLHSLSFVVSCVTTLMSGTWK